MTTSGPADDSALLEALFESDHVAMAIFDRGLRLVRANRAFARSLGRTVEALVGAPLDALVTHDSVRTAAAELARAPEAGERVVPRVPVEGGPTTELRYHDHRLVMLPDAAGRRARLLLSRTDVTDSVRVERQAAEWKLVIRELNHRVKNNLQVVSSFVRDVGYDHPAAQSSVDRALGRVAAVARMHDLLANASSYCAIDLGEYARAIAEEMRAIHGRPEVSVQVEAKATAPIDVAGQVGMILQELVANAYEHAFPAGRGGRVEIELLRDGDECLLVVRDDGTGLAADSTPSTAEGGLELVRGLCHQLRGHLEVRRRERGGTVISVRVPIPPKPPARG